MINDIAAIAYIIVIAESLYLAYRFYQVRDGAARIMLIANYLALALYMTFLLCAFLMRQWGATETRLEGMRIMTRWLTVLLALMQAALIVAMCKKDRGMQ